MGGVRRSPAGPDGRKCQKKVTQNQDGQWFCESCGKAFPAPAYRYMLNLEVVDYTESRYVSMFNDEAERLLAFCNNAGPSFILGVVGVGCFRSLRTGVYLYLVHAFSAVLVGILFRKKAPVSGQKVRYSAAFEPIPAFVRAVGEAAEGMVRLCGFVVFFLVILALITDLTGLNHPVLLGLVELTTGVTTLEGRPGDLVWAAALLGWGGLSVHGQTAAVLGDTGLGLGRYFLGKILQAIFSAGAVTFGEIW